MLAQTKKLLRRYDIRAKKGLGQNFLIDEDVLVHALQEGWIAGAGLDVFDPEPLPNDNHLLKLENVVVTPHMAAHTDEALLRMAMVVEDVIAVIEGRRPQNPVLPE